MACNTVNYLKLLNNKLYLAARDTNGKPGKLQDLGDCPMFEMNFEAEYAENWTSQGRVKVRDASFPRKLDVSAKMTLKEATLQNLAFFTHGELQTRAGETVTLEDFPATVAVGETHLLPGAALPDDVSSVVIKDSQGTPATLVLNTDYTLDADLGAIAILNLTGYTQPLQATYTTPSRSILSFARNAAAANEYWFVLIGENPNRGYEKTKLVLFRCRLTPGPLQLVDTESNEAAGSYELSLIPMADLCRSNDDSDDFGRYGYTVRLT